MGYGFAGFIGIARETNWGSGISVASGGYIEALNENLALSIDRFDYKNIIGTLAAPDDMAGVNRVAGDIAFAAHPVTLGYFLLSAFNQDTVTTVASGFLWTHSFKQPTDSGSAFSTTAPSVPYSIEVFRDVGTSVQYAGCLISALALNFAPNQAVQATASLIGRSQSIIAKTTPTFPNSPSKPFASDTVSLQLGGSATIKIEALNISIENQYEGIPALNNSTYIAMIRRTGHQMVNVTGTLDFTNHSEFDFFINQTETTLKVSATVAQSYQLTIDIPRFVYTAFPLGIRGKERVMVDFTGKGFYHSGSGTGIEIKLTTTRSFY